MNNLDMESKKLVSNNIEKIKDLFPNVIIEDNGKLAINFEALKQELSTDIIDEKKEKYQLTWPGKKESIVNSNTPTTKTLRPIKEKSLDFEKTKNIYIEGDNLEALKILQESYLNKIKIIYIDPPYNTGNDFLYNDDYSKKTNEELNNNGAIDENGNRLISNPLSNGKFHSNWLSMMYPRLKLARNLLTDDGAIFISIGQKECANLTEICNEIFGEANKVSCVSRVMKSGGAQGQYFSPNIEYILIYAKNINNLKYFREPISDEIIKKLYTSVETNGPRAGEKYRPFGLYQASLDPLRGCVNQRYYIEAPDGTLLIPPGNVMPSEKIEGSSVRPQTGEDKVWRWTKERYLEEKKKGNIVFKESKNTLLDSEGNWAKWNVYTKIWLSDREDSGMLPVDLITKWENRISKKELSELNIDFDFAKPVDLISYLINLVDNNKDAIILDFFSGSGTTAHSIFSLNSKDGGTRKFILVQIPEECDTNSKYENICDLGEDRIIKAGIKIQSEFKSKLDCGLRVYKIDSSNMKDIYYKPSDLTQLNILDMASNIKKDRTPEDLLTQVILDLGLTLDLKIEEKKIINNKVYFVENNSLIACFDDQVDINIIDEICKCNPMKVVFKDISFKNDKDKINLEERIKKLSPETEINIL